MNDQQKKFALYGAGGLAALALLFGFGSGAKAKSKRYYQAGDAFDVYMGGPFTVRLTRGRYAVLANKAIFTAANDIGNFTDIIMVAGAAPVAYTETVRFVDQDRPGTEHMVTVAVKENPSK